MHGTIFKSIEGFVLDRYGPAAWSRIVTNAGLPFDRFEALRIYDDDTIVCLCDAVTEEVGCGTFALIEDVGHWICTHPPLEDLRRLIRFTGATFEEMVYGLDELRERARLALPDLVLPEFQVRPLGKETHEVLSRFPRPGGSAMATGVLRAMADDYGVLAMIEPARREVIDGMWEERITIHIYEAEYQAPREFELGGAA